MASSPLHAVHSHFENPVARTPTYGWHSLGPTLRPERKFYSSYSSTEDSTSYPENNGVKPVSPRSSTYDQNHFNVSRNERQIPLTEQALRDLDASGFIEISWNGSREQTTHNALNSGFNDIISKGLQAKAQDEQMIYENKKDMAQRDRQNATEARHAKNHAARESAQASRLKIDKAKSGLLENMERNLRSMMEDQFVTEIEEKVYDRQEEIVADTEKAIKFQTYARLETDLEPVVRAELRSSLEAKVRSELKSELTPEITQELWTEFEPSIKQELRALLANEVRNQLRRELIPAIYREMEEGFRTRATLYNESNQLQEDDENEIFEVAPEYSHLDLVVTEPEDVNGVFNVSNTVQGPILIKQEHLDQVDDIICPDQSTGFVEQNDEEYDDNVSPPDSTCAPDHNSVSAEQDGGENSGDVNLSNHASIFTKEDVEDDRDVSTQDEDEEFRDDPSYYNTIDYSGFLQSQHAGQEEGEGDGPSHASYEDTSNYAQGTETGGAPDITFRGTKRSWSSDYGEEETDTPCPKRYRKDSPTNPEYRQNIDYCSQDFESKNIQGSYDEAGTEDDFDSDMTSDKDDLSEEEEAVLEVTRAALQDVITEVNTKETAFVVDDSDDEDETLVERSGFVAINKLQFFDDEEEEDGEEEEEEDKDEELVVPE